MDKRLVECEWDEATVAVIGELTLSKPRSEPGWECEGLYISSDTLSKMGAKFYRQRQRVKVYQRPLTPLEKLITQQKCVLNFDCVEADVVFYDYK
jgi:hypothetical protein